MARKNRRLHTEGYLLPALLVGLLVLAAMGCLLYLSLKGRAEALGTEIKKLETQRTVLRERMRVEESVAKCAAGIGKARMRKELEKKIDRVLAPQPKKKGNGTKAPRGIEDVGRELLKGGSKEILKQMLKK